MKLFKKVFEFSLFIQLILFMFFILENLYSLDTIDFTLNLEDSDLGTESESFSFNFYNMIALALVLMGIAIISSINIFSVGLNEHGSKLVSQFLAILAIEALLYTSSLYYLGKLGIYGIALSILLVIGILFKYIDILMGGNEKND